MKAYKTTMHTENNTVNLVHHSTKIVEHNLVDRTIKLNKSYQKNVGIGIKDGVREIVVKWES